MELSHWWKRVVTTGKSQVIDTLMATHKRSYSWSIKSSLILTTTDFSQCARSIFLSSPLSIDLSINFDNQSGALIISQHRSGDLYGHVGSRKKLCVSIRRRQRGNEGSTLNSSPLNTCRSPLRRVFAGRSPKVELFQAESVRFQVDRQLWPVANVPSPRREHACQTVENSSKIGVK